MTPTVLDPKKLEAASKHANEIREALAPALVLDPQKVKAAQESARWIMSKFGKG